HGDRTRAPRAPLLSPCLDISSLHLQGLSLDDDTAGWPGAFRAAEKRPPLPHGHLAGLHHHQTARPRARRITADYAVLPLYGDAVGPYHDGPCGALPGARCQAGDLGT